jgi:UDP-perosamine 4-acetyltransferase
MFILGAGTLGEIALETAMRAGLNVIGFFDDVTNELEVDGIPVLGRIDDFRNDQVAILEGAFVAIGDNQKRQTCAEGLHKIGVSFPNIIDPRATLSPSSSLGQGNLILPGAYIGTKCSLGSFNLIFPGVSITHHNHVGSFCFFSPNASVGGFTKIGDGCKVGMNCVVMPYCEFKSGLVFEPAAVIKGASNTN